MISTKKIFRSGTVITAVCFTFIQISCYKDNKETLYPVGGCDTSTITWSKDIQSIVTNSCAGSGCHDAATASGSYALHTYAGVKTIVDNGRFLAVIESGSMPKNAAKLDDCTINKVRRWINTGALQN